MRHLFLLPLFFLVSLFARAQQPETTTLFLVRHAEKADQTAASPLTEKGKARAVALANLLRDANVGAVFSTDFVRTRETARPLAEKRSLTVQLYDPQDAAFPKILIEKNRGKRVLVVGHSNTIPKLLNDLTKTSAFPNLSDAEFDALFVVTVPKKGPPTVVTLRYNP